MQVLQNSDDKQQRTDSAPNANPKSKSRKSFKPREERCVNPYSLPRHSVTIEHFMDARLYDPDITEHGWEVPHSRAKQEYLKWLKYVRSRPGWEDFRRPVREQPVVSEPVIQTILTSDLYSNEEGESESYVVPRHSNMSGHNLTVAQPQVKGVSVDDDQYRARMYTEKMGREIARYRNELGLTQSRLAYMTNVDVGIIRDIEIGGIVPFNSQDLLTRKLAKALQIPSIIYQE